MNRLPELKLFDINKFSINIDRLLIISEGFEDRSLYWLDSLPVNQFFSKAIICKYEPERQSRYEELFSLVQTRCIEEPKQLIFNRFDPYYFESELKSTSNILNFEEIVIDISVMSKLLIMIILNSLTKFKGNIRIIYCEPEDYAPKEDKYKEKQKDYKSPLKMSSFGVHNVVRTPELSSIIMFRAPTLLISFLSFNEQLIHALLSVINPTNLILINGIPPSLKWREQAMLEIHKDIINDYKNDNLDTKGNIKYKTSTLDYIETFELLAQLYRDKCYSRRIIIAPTGSKMQSVACALIKICCPDIHIEYPTPESFFIDNFSSSKIKYIHEVYFNTFTENIKQIADEYRLNG